MVRRRAQRENTRVRGMVLRTESELSRDMRDSGRFSPTETGIVPGVVPGVGGCRNRTRFLSWGPRMLGEKRVQ